jgi:hypothetical protein
MNGPLDRWTAGPLDRWTAGPLPASLRPLDRERRPEESMMLVFIVSLKLESRNADRCA